MNPARLRAYLMLILVSAIWGVASPIIKFTLEGFPPVTFLAYRFGISTIIALILFLVFGLHLPKSFKTFVLMLIYGFINTTISLGLLFFGMENTTVLEASLITLANPLLISTAGVYFLKEHVTKREKIGMTIAMLGTALTIIEPLFFNGEGSIRFSGNLLVLGYVAINVILALFAKKLLRENVNPLTLSNFGFIIGFASFSTYLLATTPLTSVITNIQTAPLPFHLGVFYMAAFSGSLAYFLWAKAQKSIEIGEASVFAYLYPVFSLPLAVLWLGEKVTPIIIIGAVIIAVGVGIAEIKKKRYNP